MFSCSTHILRSLSLTDTWDVSSGNEALVAQHGFDSGAPAARRLADLSNWRQAASLFLGMLEEVLLEG